MQQYRSMLPAPTKAQRGRVDGGPSVMRTGASQQEADPMGLPVWGHPQGVRSLRVASPRVSRPTRSPVFRSADWSKWWFRPLPGTGILSHPQTGMNRVLRD